MSYLPELRSSLVQAAAREVGAPPQRRGLSWLWPTVAAAVALAVVVMAIVLVGHGRGGAGPAGGPVSSGHSNGTPPPMPNLSGPEWNLIQKARRATVATDSACSPFLGAGPTNRSGQPSGTLTAVLGVLRQPASAADTVPLWFFQHSQGPPGVYTSAIRLAREQDGIALYVVPTVNVMGFRTVPRRCGPEEAAALDRELKGASAKQRQAARRGLRGYLVWQQYEAENSQVCLAEIDFPPHHAPRASDAAGVGCGWGVAEINAGVAGLGRTASPGPSLFHGLVPDGVVSVVLELPDHRSAVTARVVNNVYLAPIPPSVRAPLRILWRAADGGVIKTTTVHVPR